MPWPAHAIPSICADAGCKLCGGYLPTLPWLLGIFDESAVFERGSQTEQLEYSWTNAEHAGEA